MDNLVPVPHPEYWQDAPHVPFDQLTSPEAQARLALCRPINSVREAGVISGVPTYAQSESDMQVKRRGPLQIAATFGFMVNRPGYCGAHMFLKPAELPIVHECLIGMCEASMMHP